MIFVACYTLGTPYEQEAEKLRASLEHQGLRYDIRGYESRGSWLANCHYIPIFCRQMLEEHPDESVVYLDADAVVERLPVLLFEIDRDAKLDFAVHHLPRPLPVAGPKVPIRRGRRALVPQKPGPVWNELLDGTMYFRNTTASLRLLNAWIEQDALDLPAGKFEQKVLEDLLPAFPISWGPLPCEYCYIFDNEIQAGLKRGDPAIVHYQASRRLRKGQPTVLRTGAFLLKQPQPIAVVGNGAGFDRGDGERIDGYPTVIRMNNFVLDRRFTARVGQKLSAWCVNGCGDVPYRELGVPVFTVFGEGDLYSTKPWRDGRCPHLILPSAPWGKKCQEEFFASKNPSTGLTLLFMLETLGIEAHAFGFDGFASGHYWDPKPMEKCTHTPAGLHPEGAAYATFKKVKVVS